MKKLFIVASMMMLSASGFAQQEVGLLTIQPKIGLNIANVTDDSDANVRVGLAIGAELEYQITNMFSMSFGMLYSMQGYTVSGTNSVAKYDGTAKLDYINIPIIANIYVAKGLALKFGIQPAFNVNSSYKVTSNGTSISGSISDLGFDIKSFDFAIPVGLSYEYKNFVIDARYNIGVTKLVDNEDSRNSVFQFTAGYKFRL